MSLAKGCQPLDLLRCPNRPAGIVRTAEENRLGPGCQLCGQRIQIHPIASVHQIHGRIQDASVIGRDDPAKGVIDRRKQNDLVSGLAHRLQDQPKPRHHPRRRAHPAGIEGHAMASLHPAAKRLGPTAGVRIVAMGARVRLLREAPSVTPGGARKSISATHIGIASGASIPDRAAIMSHFMACVPRRSMTSSKSNINGRLRTDKRDDVPIHGRKRGEVKGAAER